MRGKHLTRLLAKSLTVFLVIALVLCVLATLWPAYYAAGLRPVDAFRDQ